MGIFKKEQKDIDKYGGYSPGVVYRLFKSCETMVDYIIESGITIPEGTIKVLEIISNKTQPLINKIDKLSTCEEAKKEDADNSISELYSEIEQINESNAESLSKAYTDLTNLVKPATPQSIEFTTPTVCMPLSDSKTIPFIRNLLIASLFIFIVFILCQIGVRVTENKLQLVFSVINQASAAALGAYFYTLYTANRYFIDRTFDPKYITYYNNRIVIGIIAGYTLPILIDPSLLEKTQNLTPSALALLGGFSSDIVIRLMNKLVAMLQTLITDDAKDAIETEVQKAKNEIETSQVKNNAESAGELYALLNNSPLAQDPITAGKLKELIEKILKGKK